MEVISSTFPNVYLHSLEYLSFGDWYTACFVADPSQASMWGYYGDSHRGACLKFKTTTLPEGEPALRLNRQIGIGGPPHAPEHIFAYSPQPLQQVHYANRYPEVDFFRSLGTLVPAQAAFWFRGEDGTMSATRKDLVLQTEEWRKQYWATFHAGVTNKLTDWQHEQEYRITLQSNLVDLSNPAERTLKYRFEDLQGIIFGMNMSTEDRAAIVRIIAAKCVETGRTDFEFYQAYYSRLSGKVEAAQWDLVKFHPAETARCVEHLVDMGNRSLVDVLGCINMSVAVYDAGHNTLTNVLPESDQTPELHVNKGEYAEVFPVGIAWAGRDFLLWETLQACAELRLQNRHRR